MAGRSQTLKRLFSYASFAVDTFLLRRERRYMFILVVNDTCNLDCFYCTTKNTGRSNLGYAAVRAALSGAYARGHRALVITGGEPMLWRDGSTDIADVLSCARELGFMDIAVFTNGTFPLAAHGVTFIVSIDGTRDVHNGIRAGTHDTIMKHVRGAHSPVMASMTVTKANARDLEDAVREIAATRLFKGITFNLLTHNPDIVERHGLLGAERIQVLDRIWRLKCQGHPIFLSKAAYIALRANNWKRPLKQVELCVGGHVFTCCRDVDNPAVCRECGYSTCVEISQAIAGRPSAILQLMRVK